MQFEGATVRDRRWRQKGRDEEYEVFIVSSWAWVWSSWPGDLLCSAPLRVLLHSLRPLCQMSSLCCFGSAYVPACILLKGDLMVLILLLLFHVDLFTYRGLFFFCYGLRVGLQDTHQLLQGIKLVPFPLQDNLFK